ncbi:5-(carboxyamino)imidazole ribonucleotide mutase [Candidatus Kryptobacter tengchongensis]|uniref:N5-carboxyaminoimidazole ribonucleotide mutase n=1 Tax=Kryptobacter tengchongensis TaxID=1643429 RepID=A0A656D0T2_KRYT1|nr:5-(carboxyamino)imidazole ribonucleotide mutase [Candidatus Kryptobacter tengchongensis]CUS96025.1 5-(carboxyamino)imidazole ribonucleotide mutase [Candidatus Kryptobacter tengchongensis]
MSKVAILMGSKSDEEIMQHCEKYLQHFGVDYEKRVLSAHRNPIETIEFARSAESNGFKVIIAGAGMAAHLPGIIAANTSLPVIGVPLPSSELNGVDALYSIVQMPPGIPVATVAIGKAGAINAAVLAVEILALQNEELRKKLEEFRKQGSKL